MLDEQVQVIKLACHSVGTDMVLKWSVHQLMGQDDRSEAAAIHDGQFTEGRSISWHKLERRHRLSFIIKRCMKQQSRVT